MEFLQVGYTLLLHFVEGGEAFHILVVLQAVQTAMGSGLLLRKAIPY